MESLLLAIALFLSSPAGQDPNREPMWFDGCTNIVEEQIDKSTWYYYCGDEITESEEEQVESNEEVQQFSFFKEAKALPKKQKAIKVKASVVKTGKTRSSRAIQTYKPNKKQQHSISTKRT